MTIQVLCMKPEDFVCLPRLVRDYLNYLSSVKGKSQLTVCEYASDLRLFFAYMLKQENLSQYKNTPIDEIDISKLDIDFISLARIPTAYGFLEYCRAERGNGRLPASLPSPPAEGLAALHPTHEHERFVAKTSRNH